MFGTNEDLVALFEKAKQLGLKIILDFVPNHTSDQHEWFQKSVAEEPGFEDFYVWRDCPLDPITGERVYPNNWVSKKFISFLLNRDLNLKFQIAVFHTRAWTYHAEREQCYLHQFLKEQPDLNYRNPVVREEMEKVLLFWLDRGVDGFRVDAINHMQVETNS